MNIRVKAALIRIKRWIEIILYACAGSIIPQIFYSYSPKKLLDMLSNPNTVLYVCGGGIVILIILNRVAGFRFNHLKTIIFYPSFLLAVLLACLAVDWHSGVFQRSDDSLIFRALESASAIYIFSLAISGAVENLYSILLSTQAKGKKGPKSVRKSLKDFSAEEIIEWAKCEDPIESNERDLLEAGLRACRILDYINKEERNTVAIVGSFGSGKTSLINLTEQRANSRRLAFVPVISKMPFRKMLLASWIRGLMNPHH